MSSDSSGSSSHQALKPKEFKLDGFRKLQVKTQYEKPYSQFNSKHLKKRRSPKMSLSPLKKSPNGVTMIPISGNVLGKTSPVLGSQLRPSTSQVSTKFSASKQSKPKSNDKARAVSMSDRHSTAMLQFQDLKSASQSNVFNSSCNNLFVGSKTQSDKLRQQLADLGDDLDNKSNRSLFKRKSKNQHQSNDQAARHSSFGMSSNSLHSDKSSVQGSSKTTSGNSDYIKCNVMQLRKQLSNMTITSLNDQEDDRSKDVLLKKMKSAKDMDSLAAVSENMYSDILKYKMLVNVINRMWQTPDTSAALKHVIDGAYHIVNAELVCLSLIDDETNELHPALCKVNGEDYIGAAGGGMEKFINQELSAFVVAKNIPIIVNDPNSSELFNLDYDLAVGNSTCSIACIPIQASNGKCTAVLQVRNKIGRNNQILPFTPEDYNLLNTIASSASECLLKLYYIQRANIASRKADLADDIMKASKSDLDPNLLVKRLLNVALNTIKCDKVTLFLCDHRMRLITSVDGLKSFKYGEGITGSVAVNLEVVNIIDAYKDARFNRHIDEQAGYQTRSMLVAPVIEKGKCYGVIELINKVGTSGADVLLPSLTEEDKETSVTFFSEDDEVVITAFCSEVAAALARKRVQLHYDKASSNMATMKAKGTNASLIRSLLKHHSTALDDASRLKLKASVLTFLALGKFKLTVKKFRAGKRLLRHSDSMQNILAMHKLGQFGSDFQCLNKNNAERKDEMIHCSLSEQDEDFKNYFFDVLQYKKSNSTLLPTLVLKAFENFGMLEKFRCPSNIMKNFISKVKSKYLDNAYHSFYHGVSVFQQVYALLGNTSMTEMLRPQDIFSVLVASLCHDIGHRGRTNDFEVQISSDLALLYNDTSVLEQHHASLTFQILRDTKCNIMCNVSQTMHSMMRKSIILNILATDMKLHFDLLQQLNNRLGEDSLPMTSDVEDDRLLVTKYTLHCADLGSMSFPSAMQREWGDLCIEEFSDQAAEEKRRGLKITQHMVGLDCPKQKAKVQVGFAEFIVLPIWETYSELLPEVDFIVENIKQNIRIYTEEATMTSTIDETDEGSVSDEHSEHEEHLEEEQKEDIVEVVDEEELDGV